MKLRKLHHVTAAMRSVPTFSSGMHSTTITEHLWRKYFEDPSQRWDSRGSKIRAKLQNFLDAEDGLAGGNDSPDPAENGEVSDSDELSLEKLRQRYFTDPRGGEAVEMRTSSRKACGLGFQTTSSIYGAGKAGNVVDRRLRRQDVFSGTALIRQHTKCGRYREALRVYKELREDGVKASSYTFVAALKACSRLGDLETGKQIHSHVIESGDESHVFVENMLVHMYAKCGSMVDARLVFDKMPHRDVASWNSMILACAQMGSGVMALQVYTQMQQEGVVPDERTFLGALKACSRLATSEELKEVDGKLVEDWCLERGRAIHSEVVKSGFESDVFVATMLVDMYGKCGSIVDARHVFERMPRRSIVSWNAMIVGYAQMGEGDEALQLYTQMQHEGLVPDERTFVGALKACSSLAARQEENQDDWESLKRWCLEKGRALHLAVVKSGLESEVFVATMLVHMYTKCGSMVDALRVFEKMPHRSVVSWTAMILGYAQMDEGEVALQLYDRMQQEGIVPDACIFVSALKSCSSLAASAKGREDSSKLLKRRCLEQGRAIHSQVMKSGFESNIFVANTLVDMYGKCGSMVDARCVFEKMPHRDVISWNAILFGYAQTEEGEVALDLYKRMQEEGVRANEQTFVAVMKACSSLATFETGTEADEKHGCLEQCRAIHLEVVSRTFDSKLPVANMLVEMYGKCGSMVEARHVFEKMPHRDVISWNAMIVGYAQMEMGEVALQLYARMQREGISPNEQTFVGALMACSALAAIDDGCGQLTNKQCLDKGMGIHSDVVRRGLESDLFIGSMLVDMYGKCGSMGHAQLVFNRLPQRDVISWNALIAGYAEQGQSDKALELFTEMQEQGLPAESSIFVSLLKACGNAAALATGTIVHAQICRAGLESVEIVATALVDMYGKCGSMGEAQKVFDAMPTRDVVTWNALIAGYARQGLSKLVDDSLRKMSQDGIQPSQVTFLSVITACSHTGQVNKGQHYFEVMRDYGITPTIKHYNCMVDLLGRAGLVQEATAMVKKMPLEPNPVTWRTLLAACQKWNNVEVGREALKWAVRMDKDDPAAYVLMSNIFADSHMWEDAKNMQTTRVDAKAWKKQGQSLWTDADGVAHTFVVGDMKHPESDAIYAKLNELKLKEEGHNEPHFQSVVDNIPDIVSISKTISN